MSGAEQVEIERKYDVAADSAVPDLTGVDGVEAVTRHEGVPLDALYFDTEDRVLAGNHIIIRRRSGGADEGWHVKLPADEGRTEVHWPLEDGSEDSVPEGVLERLAAVLKGRAVTPLARIHTVRTLVHLQDAAGNDVAEIADDEVSTTDLRAGTKRAWREWEAELLPAAPATRDERTALLDDIERVLVAAGARPSSTVAKIARALGADANFEG
jgi:inorganic triphosphatase YgiF